MRLTRTITRFGFFTTLATLTGMTLVASIAHAQVVIPNTAATAEGNRSTSTTGTLGLSPFSAMTMIAASQLSAIPTGQVLTGFRLRVNGVNPTGTYPSSALRFTNYNITVAQPALGLTLTSFGAGSGLPSSYLGTDATVVRSGPLTIAANSFTDSGAAFNPFGPLITFPTAYIYNGGDLMLYITHDGGTGPSVAIDSTDVGYGYGTSGAVVARRVSTIFNPTTLATTESSANSIPIFQLEYASSSAAAPEPGSLLFLALGGTLVLIKRRKGEVA